MSCFQETLALAALVRDKAKVPVVAKVVPVEDAPMLDRESSGSGEEEEDCLAKMLLVGWYAANILNLCFSVGLGCDG